MYLERGRRASGTVHPTGHRPYINQHHISARGRLRTSALPAVTLGGPAVHWSTDPWRSLPTPDDHPHVPPKRGRPLPHHLVGI